MSEGKFSYPYTARTSEGKKEFKSVGDVYDELISVAYQSEQEGFNIGEACYLESLFFANNEDLIDTNSQTLIKSYLYCLDSNTPPFPTLQDTPADFVDKWMVIKDEINNIRISEAKNVSK